MERAQNRYCFGGGLYLNWGRKENAGAAGSRRRAERACSAEVCIRLGCLACCRRSGGRDGLGAKRLRFLMESENEESV